MCLHGVVTTIIIVIIPATSSSILTGYGLDKEIRFPRNSTRRHKGHTISGAQSPIYLVSGILSQRAKQPKREAEVKNTWSYILNPP
jgi:hypothetical protein